MNDKTKTNEQLIQELVELRQRVLELEATEAERKQAEEALRESEKRLQAILDNSTAVVYLKDTQGQYILINRLYEALFHIAREEIVGKTDHDIFPKEMADAFRENDLKVLDAGTPLEFEEVAPHDDGIHSYISLKFPLFDSEGVPYGVCGISTDITERKRMEEELQKHRDHLEKLVAERTTELGKTVKELEGEITERKRAEAGILKEQQLSETAMNSSPGIFYLFTEEGQFLRWNRNFENVFGYSAEEIARMHPLDFVADEEKEHAAEKIQETFLRGHTTAELHLTTKVGEKILYYLTGLRTEVDDTRCLVGMGIDITERKQAEEALRTSEARSRTLLEDSPVCTKLLDLDFRLQFMSAAGQEMLCITDINPFYGQPYADVYTEPHRSRIIEHLERAKAGEIVSLEAPANDMEGREGWYHTTFVPVSDGEDRVDYIISTSINITERKRAEEEIVQAHSTLQETKQHLESLIESSTDAIIATDRGGKVTLFNEGAEALSGYRREEVLGRRAPVLYESEKDAKEVMRRMREGGGAASGFETTFRAKDGSIIPVLISASLLYDEDGQETGTVGFSKDLRVRKRAEEALTQSEKLAAVGRLTAGVAHEVLNPLQVITTNLHLMRTDPATPSDIASELQDTEGQANRIAKIAQDLLSFARQRPVERRSVDFNETIRRTVSLMEHDLKLNEIGVTFNLAPGLPSILVDQDQLQQVVLNLITNARDTMPNGGQLVLSTEVVRDDGRRFVELRVEDTGEGIDPDHLDKLFDPFFTTKPEGEGTGLGLSICQGIIEAHGGTIRAENVPGGGSSFAVRLGVEG